jgi:ribosomal protein S26
MLRLILVLLAIWIALVLVRDALRRRRAKATPRVAVETTVRCARCGVHVPTDRALQHVDGRRYCSPEHARDDG